MLNAHISSRLAALVGLATVTLLSACTAASSELADPSADIRATAEQELSSYHPDYDHHSTIHFGEKGNFISHKNAAASTGQPEELNIARATKYPNDENSTLQLGDKFHYWTTLAGQNVALSSEPLANGAPSKYYLFLRGIDGTIGAQTPQFGIGDNLAGEFAWILKPQGAGTTSQQYGPNVTQATIDMLNPATTLQVRSGANVLTETTPSLSDRDTALLVRRDLAGTQSVVRVSQGDADSCGTGFRCLRVPN